MFINLNEFDFNSHQQKKFIVTQIKSSSGRLQSQKDTLKGLGLRKIGSTSQLPINRSIAGMINSVNHLIKVEIA